DREAANLFRCDFRDLEPCADCIPGERGPVLDPPEPLLLHGGDEVAGAQKRGRDVTMVGVNREDVRWQFSLLLQLLVWGIASRMQTSQAERKLTYNGAT